MPGWGSSAVMTSGLLVFEITSHIVHIVPLYSVFFFLFVYPCSMHCKQAQFWRHVWFMPVIKNALKKQNKKHLQLWLSIKSTFTGHCWKCCDICWRSTWNSFAQYCVHKIFFFFSKGSKRRLWGKDDLFVFFILLPSPSSFFVMGSWPSERKTMLCDSQCLWVAAMFVPGRRRNASVV